ncbi:hypothetical protein GCM10010313_34800 [Streptomyces violarus]|uniref:Extensin n=1 Tax=Streptomyces violarus TaxID=67380 RepID=A0A7W4ZPC7_9ACTN|nr:MULTISPECIES: hypothetical protein [Streptomyces]MBB3076198.1 hypothetical protein [Streptomyces violarus]WRT99021.1 hypothetical protein VJ737_15550 [Streptomyces sp. CGMCC 4.1772]GHD11538.1 hypothetical protein GCM10010313_34800 [Streptomyces violarus]
MADEQYRWLDRETAERLLSGEPLEAVDGADQGQAERLARTLGALSASPPLTSEELPGEAAAMAAFRKVRAERADAAAALAAPEATGGQAADEVVDAGLVRIGTSRGSGSGAVRRPRWARPARLALAAVLAVGMVGGIAVAAGTGVLTPFGGDEPDPGSSVSAAVSPPGRPLESPSPSDAVQGGSTPDDAPSGPAAGGSGGSGRGEARDGAAPKPNSGERGDRPGDSRRKITSACRDLRDGKRLNADRRRALRDAAGGTRVWKYCKGVLSTTGSRSTDRNDEGSGKGRHKDNDRDGDRDKDRDGDRKRDKSERKADRQAEKRSETRSEKRNDDDDDADRDRARQSLAPLRPAVSYSVKISWPRV